MLFCGSYSFLKKNIVSTVKKIKQENPLSKLTFVVHSNMLKSYIKETITKETGILANAEFYTPIDISKKLTQIEPLGDFEKEIILKKVLYEKGYRLDSLPEDFNILIQQIKEYKIPLEKIKSRWILEIITEYEKIKERNSLFDREDTHRVAVEKDSQFYTDYLFIVGIKSVPVLHQDLFKKLKTYTRKNVFVFVPFIFDSGYYQNYDHFKEIRQFYEELSESHAVVEKNEDQNQKVASYIFKYDYEIKQIKTDNIKILESDSEKKEIENIAKKIVSIVLDGESWHKIGVIIPDFSRYLPFIKQIFSKYNIPYYLAEENRYIDYPQFQKVLTIFQAKVEQFSRESLLNILSKKILNIQNIQDLEKELILAPHFQNLDELKTFIKNEKFISLIEKLNLFPEETSLKHYVDLSKDLIEEFFYPCAEKEFILEVLDTLEHSSFYRKIFEKISYEEFVGLIKKFFEQENKENRIKADTVTVIKPTSAEGNNFKYLFFAGLNQNIFPSLFREELLVPSSQLEGFEYRYHILMQQLANFCALFDREKKIYLSYLTGSYYSKNILPSIFVEEVKRILYPEWYFHGKKPESSTQQQIFSKKDFIIQNMDLLKENIDYIKKLYLKKEKGENLSSDDFTIKVNLNFPVSATDFQVYAVCPYRFYLEKVLKTEEEEIPDRTKISPLDKGILIHEILKEFYLNLDIQNPQIDEKQLEELFISGIKELLSSVIPSRRPFEEKQTKKLFLKLLSFIKEDIRRLKEKNLKPATELLEKQFSDELFTGRIDRADKDQDENYYLYDYKTGEYIPDNITSKIKNKFVQVLIYKRFLENQGKKVKQIGVIFINDKTEKFYYTVNCDTGYDSYIDNLVKLLKENRFFPVKSEECKYCQFKDICPKEKFSVEFEDLI